MSLPEPMHYAARLNSFKVGADAYWPGKNRVTTVDLLERAATVEGLNAADLNYPDHFEGTSAKELKLKSASPSCASGRLLRPMTIPSKGATT